MTIQWYPGHMAKARRIMESRIKQVDVVLELVDARLPLSSRNPVLYELSTRKPSIVIMTRDDLADPDITNTWKAYFKKLGMKAIAIDVVSGDGLKRVHSTLQDLNRKKLERVKQTGQRRSVIRAMVVGIPNVGKSSFINKLARRSVAKTGNQPGVTKQEQWVRWEDIELLDTPGVLWPKIDTPEQGLRLAASGAVKEHIYDEEEVAGFFLAYATQYYPQLLETRYQLSEVIPVAWVDTQTSFPNILPLMEQIGHRRKMLIRGGEVDTTRVAKTVLKELQDGIIGRITLEHSP